MGLTEPRPYRPTGFARASTVSKPYLNQLWYAAYMAALFEADRRRIEERIDVAAQLIVERERELSVQNTFTSEERALKLAARALEALSICLRG